jgi:glucoamylase
MSNETAPGAPGIVPRWTSSAKSGVGTARNPRSRVWFTLSHGIINEVYYPRVDLACTRDMGLIITDGQQYVSEEKRHTSSEVSHLASGVPAFRLVNTATDERYRIEKEILSDPYHDVVLQRTRFVPLHGTLADYHVYVILAPHLENHGAGNNGWLDENKGVPVLCAQRHDRSALALACSAPWLARSVGYVGVSDGWQDLIQHGRLTQTYERAEGGNIALTGEIDLQSCGGEFTLALGFAEQAYSAAHHARTSLFTGFIPIRNEYIAEWQHWQKSLIDLDNGGDAAMYRTSIAVLHTHEDKQFRGGLIASLSIPWGNSKGDNDLGGYHLVWARDLVESVGGLMAAGATDEVARVMRYLALTQEADGHWPQNMWLDGTAYWHGVQLDEAGFPIVLLAQAWRAKAIGEHVVKAFWPMARRATAFIVRNGPATDQDRWEENSGYSPFTLAVAISALLAAADLADVGHEAALASYLRETADAWNSSIEYWTYASGTDLARKHGVEGYYVRIAPADAQALPPPTGTIRIKNLPPDKSAFAASAIVSPDALALVRFGLRAADDPRMVNTVKIIDAMLKVDTPCGPAWHRYNEDGYGEHEDGSPFDGTGVGRAWPLLTGERAHYELAAGRTDMAKDLLAALERFADEGGMLPEQVWDAADIPEKGLYCGRPSGSAMPLVWAHSEAIKLRRSLRDGRVFDMPAQTEQRYLRDKTGSARTIWRFRDQRKTMAAGQVLRIEVLAPAEVHWSADGWQHVHDLPTSDTGLGVYLADLPTAELTAGSEVVFTFRWPEAGHWEGANFAVRIV